MAAFCQEIYKGIEGSGWEELYHHHREKTKAAGTEKPSEKQKSKGAVGYESSQMNSMTQPAKKTFWEGNRQDWICGKSTSKTLLGLWTKL